MNKRVLLGLVSIAVAAVLSGAVIIRGPVVPSASFDSDALAFKTAVEADGGTVDDISRTSTLVTILKGVSVGSGNAYDQLVTAYYPGAYKLFNVDGRLDVIYDLSGNGNDWGSNNSDSNRPVRVAAQLAGQAVSRHGTNQGWMRAGPTIPQPVSVIAVVRPDGSPAGNNVFDATAFYSRYTSNNALHFDGVGAWDGTTTDSAWSTFAIRVDSSLGANGWKLWVNATLAHATTPSSADDGSDLKIGGTFDNGSHCDTALILFYGSTITDTEIENIENAIRTYYSL